MGELMITMLSPSPPPTSKKKEKKKEKKENEEAKANKQKNKRTKSNTVKFRKQAFKGPFWGAYLRREIYVSKLIELALYLAVNLPFLLCFTLYLRAILLYLEWWFNGGFFALSVWGGGGLMLILEGLIFGILLSKLTLLHFFFFKQPANYTNFN